MDLLSCLPHRDAREPVPLLPSRPSNHDRTVTLHQYIYLFVEEQKSIRDLPCHVSIGSCVGRDVCGTEKDGEEDYNPLWAHHHEREMSPLTLIISP